MNAPVIRVADLGKRYELGRTVDPHRTIREALMDGVAGMVRARQPRGARRNDDDSFWALRDISFEVAQGEAIGIIGGNGAGKSTLLKILSRITAPTTGRGEIRGRVGSLLEVGTGFHPDLTGRENVFLNGAILGMRRSEITRKFDEIVAFAEVERFIDTPVKRYSSGMYLRLAFAVAAHLEPEVLLVDEVLAVGDAAFQKKCLGKMGDAAHEGRTVIFVSHSMDAVLRLCSRAVLLERGRVVEDGISQTVIARYLARGATTAQPRTWIDLTEARRSGSGAEARFSRVRWGVPDDPVGSARPGGPLALDLEVVAPAAVTIGSLGVTLRNQTGIVLVNADIIAKGQLLPLAPGRNLVRLDIDALYVNPGRYVISLWLSHALGGAIDHIEAALELDVIDVDSRGLGTTPMLGALVPCRFAVAVTELSDERGG